MFSINRHRCALAFLMLSLLQGIPVKVQGSSCTSCNTRIPFDASRYQEKYFIGVLANRGKELGYTQYGPTFTEFLTLTAGQRFEPPIEFEIVPVTFQEMFDFAGDKLIDFTYVNPSASVCIAAQYGTQALLSLSQSIPIDGMTQEVSEFSGLIIARADNDQVSVVADLKDKVVGAVSIASHGGAMLQFHEMVKAEMSFINDPKAMIFTENQFKVIQGVLDGDFDAGFVRTGIIEQMANDDGDLIDPTILKILEPKQATTSEGAPFPYVHSTALTPEWQMAALGHVASEVSEEVQHALYNLNEYARTGQLLKDCDDPQGILNCSDVFEVDPEAKCDTTTRVAQSALQARINGGYSGFRPTLSYDVVRNLLQDTGLISPEPQNHVWACNRPAELYDSIVCPKGHFLMSRADFEDSCATVGINCPEGYNCACKPCFKATDLEVAVAGTYRPGEGCVKMSMCGSIEKSQSAAYQIIDNRNREGLDMHVVVHEGSLRKTVEVSPASSPNVYEFPLSSDILGTLIVEIFLGDEQIPASPLRVEIVPKECQGSSVLDDLGNCVCPDYTLDKHLEADRAWLIDGSELTFDEPARTIGEGATGIAVLAEYKGSKVAVKKAYVVREDAGHNSKHKSALHADTSEPGNSSVAGSSANSDPIDVERPLPALCQERSNARCKQSRTSSSCSSSGIGVGRRWNLSRSRKTEFLEEVRLLTQLRHPNVASPMGAVAPKKGPPLLILEYMEHGSLYEVIHNPTIQLEAVTTLQIMRDIAKGLRFLHSWHPPIVHGDVKSSNILIDATFRAKLSDIVCSKPNSKKPTGSTLWMAPELLLGVSRNTKASDMYSVGIVFCEIFSGQDPYEDALVHDNELANDVCDETISRRPVLPDWLPKEGKELIKDLWRHQPASRPTIEQLDNRISSFDATKVHPKHAGLSTKTSERAHMNDFLYQAFPEHIADILLAGGKVEPEAHLLVTIVFSDIVGFTTIASRFSPLKVSSLLDRLYLKFDEIAQRHDLFKIETIGDAYMAAANLVKDQSEDHAKRSALFARDLIQAAHETPIDEDDPSEGNVSIRVGFHSGPVVSNVVGSLNPRYGLFGDTVNVASRMESTSETGRIHCSKESAKLLMSQAPEIPLIGQGKIPIKGRGKMTTFWVS